jgi:hypothetical protein
LIVIDRKGRKRLEAEPALNPKQAAALSKA